MNTFDPEAQDGNFRDPNEVEDVGSENSVVDKEVSMRVCRYHNLPRWCDKGNSWKFKHVEARPLKDKEEMLHWITIDVPHDQNRFIGNDFDLNEKFINDNLKLGKRDIETIIVRCF